MVRIGERFYTSLGFAPLPQTFWERSLFVRPRDREVVCHASAWDIDLKSDVRIKMCIDQTAEDFSTIHHELGHNFYQRAYKDQPVIFRDSANDGFHEAIGDTIALSVTPEYLVRIGLLDKAPDASRDIGLLMSRALEKVAFLPFGLRDRPVAMEGVLGRSRSRSNTTRRGGTSGRSIRASRRRRPAARSSSTRARSITCRTTRRTRAISWPTSCSSSSTARWRRRPAARRRCTAARSTRARKPASGWTRCSRWACRSPGPTRCEALTGSKQMDASAILDYFAPLKTWLDEQLKDKPIGW